MDSDSGSIDEARQNNMNISDDFQEEFDKIFTNRDLIGGKDCSQNEILPENDSNKDSIHFKTVDIDEVVIKKEKPNVFTIYNEDEYPLFHPINNNKKKSDYKFTVENTSQKRKKDKDNIIKKILTHFLKDIELDLNKKLISNDIKDFKCQGLTGITNNLNNNIVGEILNKTLEELISSNLRKNKKGNNEQIENKENENKKIMNTKNLLECLKKNENDDKKIKKIYNIFHDFSIKQLYELYLKSKEFQDSINEIGETEQDKIYMKNLIEIAENLVNDFSK